MIDLKMSVEPLIIDWHIVEDKVCFEYEGEAYVFNDTGSKIWKMLNGYITIEEIIDKMEKEPDCNASHDEVKNLIVEFIENLVECKFINLKQNDEEEW